MSLTLECKETVLGVRCHYRWYVRIIIRQAILFILVFHQERFIKEQHDFEFFTNFLWLTNQICVSICWNYWLAFKLYLVCLKRWNFLITISSLKKFLLPIFFSLKEYNIHMNKIRKTEKYSDVYTNGQNKKVKIISLCLQYLRFVLIFPHLTQKKETIPIVL